MSIEFTADEFELGKEHLDDTVVPDKAHGPAQTPVTPATEAPRIVVPTRIFKLGSLELIDPDPTLAPLEALRLYRANYPHLAHAQLSEPRLEGDRMIYEIEKPPVATKGAESAAPTATSVERLTFARARQILRAWSKGTITPLPAEGRLRKRGGVGAWNATQHRAFAAAILKLRDARTPATVVDPWILPPH